MAQLLKEILFEKGIDIDVIRKEYFEKSDFSSCIESIENSKAFIIRGGRAKNMSMGTFCAMALNDIEVEKKFNSFEKTMSKAAILLAWESLEINRKDILLELEALELNKKQLLN